MQVESAAAIDGSRHALSQAQAAPRCDGRAVGSGRTDPAKARRYAGAGYKPGEQRDLDRLINNAR